MAVGWWRAISRTVNVAARYSAALWIVGRWVSVEVIVISLDSNLEGMGGCGCD
jgi:hypothetical protein